jgi:hypothetical protein
MDEKIPFISEALVEFLNKRFNTDLLINEGDSEGLERLGFLKGARYIISCMSNISRVQREDVNF